MRKMRRRPQRSSRLRHFRNRTLLGLETLEHRRVLAAYINELHMTPTFGDVGVDQYVEIRSEPNARLPVGTYFVGVQSDDGVFELGDIHTIINLSNQRVGSNGLLVLTQAGNGYATDLDANVLQGTDGFLGLGGGIYQADNDSRSIRNGSQTYFLIQSDTIPNLSMDIDADDDGRPDGAFLGWQVLDGVSIIDDNIFFERAYAPIVFRRDAGGDGEIPGSTLIDTNIIGYVARVGNSTGYDPSEWMSGRTRETTADSFEFELTHGLSTGGIARPFYYGGRILDHVGAPNWYGSISGTTFLDNNGDGIQQADEAGIAGLQLVADFSGEGLAGHYEEVIEPDNFAAGTNLTNISSNVTMVTAGSDNVPLQFKTRAQQSGLDPSGQHVFASEGVDFHNNNSRLRMDFYRPVRSVGIDVIGRSDLRDTYGRLEIFNENDQSLGFVRSQALGANDREALEISAGDDVIAWAVAYSDDGHLNSSPFGRFDRLRFELLEPTALTDANGDYEIPVPLGVYSVGAVPVNGLEQVHPGGSGKHNVTIDRYQNATNRNFGFQGLRPPMLPDQSYAIGELAAGGTVIGTLPVTPGYPSQQLSFSILSGNPGGLFVVDTESRELRLTRADLDFESIPRYVMEVHVADTANSQLNTTATVTVTVEDQNDPPVVADQEVTVNENTDLGVLIGTILGSDQDSGAAGNFTWSIVGGNIGDSFAVDSDTGDITVANNAAIDFETNPTFSLVLRATDMGDPAAAGEGTMTVTVVDINEPPVIRDDPFSAIENSPAGTVVGRLIAVDPDAGQTITWITHNPQNFTVDETGQIRVADGADLNFEQDPVLTLDVEATDSGNPAKSHRATVSIQITDINDAPVLEDSNLSIPEDAASGDEVGVVVGQDEDAGQTLTYSISGGADSASVQIDPVTGSITIAPDVSLDHETQPTLQVEVSATDSHGNPATTSRTYEIGVSNVNEPPSFVDLNFTVPENSPEGTLIANLGATDPDTGDTLTYTLIGQSSNWASLNEQTGDVRVAAGASINFEQLSETTLTARVTDVGGLSAEATVTITATDENDPPLLANPLSDVEVIIGEELSITIPADTFADEDVNDELSIRATTASGFSLPSWMNFDRTTLMLTGTPSAADEGVQGVRITAIDQGGERVFDTFDVTVKTTPFPWHNEVNQNDVNNDDFVSPIDALMVVNYLNRDLPPQVPAGSQPVNGFLDVNQDNFVTPLDALIVINELNSRGGGEGESNARSAIDFRALDVGFSQEDDEEQWLSDLALEIAYRRG